MSELTKSTTDLVTSFTIFLNGEKLGGVNYFDVKVDLEGNLATIVTLEMAIKKDSFKIYKKGGYRVFSFESFVRNNTQELFKDNNKHAKNYKTLSDHTYNDVVVMNGKKLRRIQEFDLKIRPDTQTKVRLVMSLECGGLRIFTRKNGCKDVYLDTK